MPITLPWQFYRVALKKILRYNMFVPPGLTALPNLFRFIICPLAVQRCRPKLMASLSEAA